MGSGPVGRLPTYIPAVTVDDRYRIRVRKGLNEGMNGNDRGIARFTMVGHGVFHGHELSIPVFLVVWLTLFDLSTFAWGIALGVAFGLVGIGSPIAGVLADRYPARRLVSLSAGGMGLALALMALVGTLPAVLFGLAAWGVAASVYHPAALALISRGADERGTVLGYHGAAGSLGTVIGPLAVLLALAFFDWRPVMLALAVPALAVPLVGSLSAFDERAAVEAERAGSVSTPREFLADSRVLFTSGFLVVFAVVLTYGIYYRGLFTFLPDVLSRLTVFQPMTVGGETIDADQFAYSALLLVGVIGQYAGGRLSDRHRPDRVLIILLLAVVAGTLSFLPASAAGVLPLLAICVVLGFTIYAVAPITQTLVAEHAPPEHHGISFGYTYLGTFGFGALGASIGGAALTLGGEPALFLALAGAAGVCVLVAAVLSLRTR